MDRKLLPRRQGIKPSRALTIRDVAKAAGVSVSTVSKALNGNGQLREETRTAVRSVAERLRFRPNEMARSLPGPRCFTVGLISIDRKGRFSIPVLDGVEDTLDAAEISVFLCNTADNPERERQHVRALNRWIHVAGFPQRGRKLPRLQPLTPLQQDLLETSHVNVS